MVNYKAMKLSYLLCRLLNVRYDYFKSINSCLLLRISTFLHHNGQPTYLNFLHLERLEEVT